MYNRPMKIGVFDSGRGGEFIASGLRKLLPQHEFIVVNDHTHVPYGSRSSSEITMLTTAAIQPLISAGCPVIVIACNTATMVAIQHLRTRYPAVQFVGTDPMVKPAAQQSATRHITVLATPRTLASPRYLELITTYGKHVVIDQPPTADWAKNIEDNRTHILDFNNVTASIASGSDTIVLACTHYITLTSQLAELFPGVRILEPTAAIARQITRVTPKL